MPWTAKVLGLNLTRICFLMGNIVSNKIFGQLLVCLSGVGLFFTSWNCFFLLCAFFFNDAFSV